MASMIYASQLICLWRQSTGCCDILSYFGRKKNAYRILVQKYFVK